MFYIHLVYIRESKKKKNSPKNIRI